MNSKGFTLIEILLAVGILGIIFSMVYWTFSHTYDVIDAVESEMDGFRSVRLSLNKMSDELSSVYWRKDSKDSLFAGEDLEDNGHPMDSLRFMSSSNYGFYMDGNESDINIINYYLERGAGEKTYRLMRSEQINILGLSDEHRQIFELGESVSGLDLRYFDGKEWIDRWNSEELGAIPMAVEIKMLIRDNNGREKTFMTITEIPIGRTVKRP